MVLRSPGTSGLAQAISHYNFAIRDPFDVRAEGVRMVDSFRYPTATLKFSKRGTLWTDAGGVLAFQVFPSPFYCAEFFNGTSSLSGLTANASSKHLATPNGILAAAYGAYRTVAWGFRILLADTVSNAKGIYTVANFPLPRNSFLDWNIMNGNAYVGVRKPGDYIGAPRPDDSLELLSTRRTFNAQDLQYQGDFMGVGVPYNVTCADFRPLSTPTQSPYISGTLFSNYCGSISYANGATPSTISDMGSVSLLDMAGNTGFSVYASGLPSGVNECSIELVYHMELLPFPTTNLSATPTCSASPPGSTTIFENLLSRVSDTLYLGKQPISRFLGNLGMAGVRYAVRRSQRRIEAIA